MHKESNRINFFYNYFVQKSSSYIPKYVILQIMTANAPVPVRGHAVYPDIYLSEDYDL